MKRILIFFVLIIVLSLPVRAMDLSVPAVPERAEKFMPVDGKNFTEDLLSILRDALLHIRPDLKEASGICICLTALMLITSILRSFPGAAEKTVNLTSAVTIALMLLNSTGSLINLASTTVREISEYGKLLLPVMTAAMAGQGGVTTSAALYAGTAIFNALLTSVIGKMLIPLVYFFIFLAVASSAVGNETLKKMRNTIKQVVTWSLKTILYIYTGYIGITGIISGATDAAAIKATKLTISSVVPVVGSILADASEAILVSASTIKNAAGIYGFYAIIAIWIGPFLEIGSHYILLKATGALCSTFSNKSSTELMDDYSSALGLLLAMTGANCLMLLISLVCFLKGVG